MGRRNVSVVLERLTGYEHELLLSGWRTEKIKWKNCSGR
jgi:hypothetical protein